MSKLTGADPVNAGDTRGALEALQRGPGGPWNTQNFGWMSHKAFGSTNNWMFSS